MVDHVNVNGAEMAASAHFPDEVRGLLGFIRQFDHGVATGSGTESHPVFWIRQGPDDGPDREVHEAVTHGGELSG